MNDLIDGVRIEGSVNIGGHDIYAKDVDVIELRKRVGMVFQKSNPFPKSIYENVVYPLRVAGQNKKAVLDETVERSLQAAALSGQGAAADRRAAFAQLGRDWGAANGNGFRQSPAT